MGKPHLTTVDELRAAGTLDVPPAWRKSLHVERELPLFPEENDASPRQSAHDEAGSLDQDPIEQDELDQDGDEPDDDAHANDAE